VAASWRHSNGHMNPLSCYTGRRALSGLTNFGDHSCVVGTTQHAPVTGLMRRVRADVEGALFADNSRKISEGSTFSMPER